MRITTFSSLDAALEHAVRLARRKFKRVAIVVGRSADGQIVVREEA